jgi:hypothetical protein
MSCNDEVQIEEDDYEKLVDGFDTTTILGAVDQLDELRGDFADRENGEPLELRDDLLKLHQLAMDVVNNGMRRQALEMFVLAGDIESEFDDLITRLQEVRGTIEVLTDLCPGYLYET